VDRLDDIDELRAAANRDPQGAAGAASRLAATARAGGDPALLSRALAVLGRARRALGAIDLAEADLAEAIDAGTAAGDDELVADAHLGLAGVYAFAGRSVEALAQLESVQRLGSDRIRAYGSLQLAALEQRIGRLPEALAGYERALPALRALDAWADIAIVLMNRGVIRTQLGDCDAAIADLTEAGRLFAAGDNAYGCAQARHGLGWAYARRGDLAPALRYLDDAADRFRALGHTAPEVEVDRVEVLLAAGLFVTAGDAAYEVAERLTVAGDRWHAAEAWLLCARAALLGGDRVRGSEFAERARAQFAEHGSTAWERLARLDVVRARQGGRRPGDVAELRGLAEELDTAGNIRAAASALALACVAAAEDGALDLAETLSRECARRAARLGVFEVRLQARYAQAICAEARGDGGSARRHVRSGLEELRRHRAAIAASDVQAAVAIHAEQLAAVGMRLALQHGSPTVLLDWMERVRADGPTRPAAHRPADAGLAAQLSELRSVVARLRAAESEGTDTVDLLRRQRDLERMIHRRELQSAADGDGAERRSRPTLTALRAALAGSSLIELAEVDGRLVGVRISDLGQDGFAGRVRAGTSRIEELGPAPVVYQAVAAAGAALRSLVADARTRSGRSARLDLLGRALAAIDSALAPLLAGDDPVVLVVPAGLNALPWHIVPSLAGRPVSVAPSATWWYATAAGTARRVGADDPALVVAGPRLAVADSEVAAVARCYPRATVLTGAAATTAAVTAAMADAPVAHVACHGRIRDDNALWSSLELFDGPLYLYDLERLGRTPQLVVLSGCETGVGVRVGNQLIGLSTVLLRRGTRSIVASVCPLPDSAATRETMTALHQRLAAGMPPAAALARLAAGWRRDDDGSLIAAAIGCFGMH